MGMTVKEKQEFRWLADAVGKMSHEIIELQNRIKVHDKREIKYIRRAEQKKPNGESHLSKTIKD